MKYIMLYGNRKWEEIQEEEAKGLLKAEEIQSKKAYYVIGDTTYLSPAEVQASAIVGNILERTGISTQSGFEKRRMIMYVFFGVLSLVFSYIGYMTYTYTKNFDLTYMNEIKVQVQKYEESRTKTDLILNAIAEKAKVDMNVIDQQLQVGQEQNQKDASVILKK